MIGCSSNSSSPALKGDDFVLTNMSRGLNSFYSGDKVEALTYFSFANESINQIWSNTADAARASSLWHGESAKNFKGEVYERQMVNYYLGILYFNKMDFGNAQAAFRQALIFDSANSQKDVQFKLLILLQAISLYYQDSISQSDAALAEYSKYNGKAFDEMPNVIVLLETGLGPRKIRSYNDQLEYLSINNVTSSTLSLSNGMKKAGLNTNIFALAAARGQRFADKYNETKNNVRDAGRATSEIASHLINSTDDDASQALFFTLSVASMIFSESIKIDVDTRYWFNLPANIDAFFLKLKPGTYKIKLEVNEGKNAHSPINAEFKVNDDGAPQIINLTDLLR